MENSPESKLAYELTSMGLPWRKILSHHKRIKEAACQDNKLDIIDTCRLDNGRIYSLCQLPKADQIGRVSSFVPAAGASSRYGAPLRQYLASRKREDLKAWILPNQVDPRQNDFDAQEVLQRPKALQPAVESGETYLLLKHMEHLELGFIKQQYFIVPPGYTEQFNSELASEHVTYFEQGLELSTIRFHKNGNPWRDPTGHLSVVPAGHGALIEKLSDIKKDDPLAESLFIRNIDNISGSKKQVLEETTDFFKSFQATLDFVKKIRSYLKINELDSAAKLCHSFLESINGLRSLSDHEVCYLDEVSNKSEKLLLKALFVVFQLPVELAKLRSLEQLYHRPVNFLGMVPNTNGDIGGQPALIQTQSSGPIALCIELPHVTDEQKETILKNPEKATHFNPVYVAAELPDSSQKAYDLEENPFWIVSHKNYQGQPVVYFETVLYEILGNSLLANVIFCEIDRIQFNPHKTLDDTIGNTLEKLGF